MIRVSEIKSREELKAVLTGEFARADGRTADAQAAQDFVNKVVNGEVRPDMASTAQDFKM